MLEHANTDEPRAACGLCRRTLRGAVDEEFCRRCKPIVDGVERLRRTRPFSIIAVSSFPPFKERPISGHESLNAAFGYARVLIGDGVEVRRVENDHTGERWAVRR